MLEENKFKLSKIFKAYKLSYACLFGSVLNSFNSANDIDLILGKRKLSIKETIKISKELEEVLGKTVDVKQLNQNLNPFFIFDLHQNHKLIWSDSRLGKNDYIDDFTRYIAVAEDDILSYPREMRKKDIKNKIQKLKDVA